MALCIRYASPADANCLADFNRANALETEGRQLPPETAHQGVGSLLAHPEQGFYLVAQSEGVVVGSLMVTSEWSDWRNGLFWWLQSVYVEPAFRRQGIYRALYERVRAEALRAGGVCGLRLYVERENHPARTVYETLGMQPTSYRLYEALF